MSVGTSRSWRIVVAALVLPALVLAAVAARSHRPFTEGSASDRGASSLFVDTLFTLAAVLLIVFVGALFWAQTRVPRQKARPDRGRRSLGGLLLYLAVITGAFLLLRHGLEQPRPAPEGEDDLDSAFPAISIPDVPQGTVEPAAGPEFLWPLALGAVVLIAAVVAVAIIVRRRRREVLGPSSEELAALGLALDEAIEDLRAEPDPRRAVVAAYARMEQALTVFGLPRRPSEAPYEYLTRVGRELEAERSVSSLTELFEVAKFSSHAVDEPMRGRAIDALSAVRDEVRRTT